MTFQTFLVGFQGVSPPKQRTQLLRVALSKRALQDCSKMVVSFRTRSNATPQGKARQGKDGGQGIGGRVSRNQQPLLLAGHGCLVVEASARLVVELAGQMD